MNFASIPSISPITGYGSVPIEHSVTPGLFSSDENYSFTFRLTTKSNGKSARFCVCSIEYAISRSHDSANGLEKCNTHEWNLLMRETEKITGRHVV